MRLSRWIRYLYYYLCGNYIAKTKYDFSKFNGKAFIGRYHNIVAPGWKWVVLNYRNSKKNIENLTSPYPISQQQKVLCPENIEFYPDNWDLFQVPGCYFQALGRIKIGKDCFIAPNVGIITSNHTVGKLEEHEEPQEVVLGDRCWIGMNAVILPGVVLGDDTVVGAGSVVTKSFPQGKVVIVGNPAKIIKQGEKNEREIIKED